MSLTKIYRNFRNVGKCFLANGTHLCVDWLQFRDASGKGWQMKALHVAFFSTSTRERGAAGVPHILPIEKNRKFLCAGHASVSSPGESSAAG